MAQQRAEFSLRIIVLEDAGQVEGMRSWVPSWSSAPGEAYLPSLTQQLLHGVYSRRLYDVDSLRRRS